MLSRGKVSHLQSVRRKGSDERQAYIRDNMESWEPGKLSKVIAEREKSFALASSKCFVFIAARRHLT